MQPHLEKLNPFKIEFLRPLDQLMKVYCQTDKAYFCQLLDRKKQLMENLISIGIDHEKYFAFVTQVFKSQSEQKQFARMDLLLLRDKHIMNKEAWFQDLVIETQTILTQQQTIYNEYQSHIQKQPKPQPTQNQPQSSTSLNINITQLTNLKLLDDFMSKYYETAYKQTFMELFEKKLRMLGALQTGKLTNDEYLMITKKIFNETKNDEVRKVIKSDLEMLEDLHDNRVADWIKQAVKQAKDELRQQKDIYEMHKKGIEVKKKEKKQEIDLDAMMMISIPKGTDPAHCISFPLLDRYMKQSKSNPQLYVPLYQKKQKLLVQQEDGRLTANAYLEMIKRIMGIVPSDDLKEIYQQELNDIQDVYEGNIKQWFENVLENTRMNLMIQEDIYKQFKKEYIPIQQPKKVQPKVQEPKKIQPVKKQQPKVVEKYSSKAVNVDPVLGYNIENMYSLKVLQNALLIHYNIPELFMKLFAQKKKIVQMMMSKQLNAQKYKKLQQGLLEQLADNEQVKDEIEIDLQALTDDHDGDVTKWFMDVVENAGVTYDSQMERYEKEMAKGNEKKMVEESMNERIQLNKDQQELESVTKPHKTGSQKPQPVKPQPQQSEIPTPFNISQMYSLKVIDTALTQNQSNQRLYLKLFAQKQAIIKKMQKGQIDAQKYKKIQEKVMEVFKDNEEVKDAVEFDLADIDDIYDGDVRKWFEEVVNSAGVGYENQLERFMRLEQKYGLKDKKKEAESTAKNSSAFSSTASIHTHNYESPQKQLQSKLSQASNQINHSTPKSKIRFYLHEMAIWQSFARYYEKNNLDPNNHKLLKIYFNVSRHEVQDIIEKIKTEPGYDIVSYCKKFFPPITEAVFYQGSENFEERVEHGIKSCQRTIQQLQEYAKNLRKNLNTKNFQKVKEEIREYQQNIKYLTNLPSLVRKNNKLIPLPLIEENPLNYTNMDEYTHLQANEIELKLIKIQNLHEQQLIKIYFDGTCRHESKVKNGSNNIVIKGKQTTQNFSKVLRGNHRSFSISMYTEGWFKKTKNGQQSIEMQFIRTNIFQGKVTIGKAAIFYEARVRMAKSPLMTEINSIKIVKFPAYEHSKQAEDDLLVKYTTTSKA